MAGSGFVGAVQLSLALDKKTTPGAPSKKGARREASFPVNIAWGNHPFPFRTRQLSPTAPMVLRGELRGRVGHRRE